MAASAVLRKHVDYNTGYSMIEICRYYGKESMSIKDLYAIVWSHLVLELVYLGKKLNGFVLPSGVLILFEQGGHLTVAMQLAKHNKQAVINGYVTLSQNNLSKHSSMSSDQIETCRILQMRFDEYGSFQKE